MIWEQLQSAPGLQQQPRRGERWQRISMSSCFSQQWLPRPQSLMGVPGPSTDRVYFWEASVEIQQKIQLRRFPHFPSCCCQGGLNTSVCHSWLQIHDPELTNPMISEVGQGNLAPIFFSGGSISDCMLCADGIKARLNRKTTVGGNIAMPHTGNYSLPCIYFTISLTFNICTA